jgi:hypothetical protein
MPASTSTPAWETAVPSTTDPALEHARAQLSDAIRRRHALAYVWMPHFPVSEAIDLARADRILTADDREESFDIRNDAHVRQCMATGRLEPLPLDAREPEPESVAAAAVESMAARAAVPTPDAVTPEAEPVKGPSYGWDRVPKAIARDRRLTLDAVRLYGLLLDLSHHHGKTCSPQCARLGLASVSQAQLAEWMGFGMGNGRTRVGRGLALLCRLGYAERTLKGQRMGVHGLASQYRVRSGALALAPEDDVRGTGLVAR